MKKLLYIVLFVTLGFGIKAGNDGNERSGEKTSTKTLFGKITDVNGEALVGAKITIAETGETVFSDLEGYYKLTIKTDKVYSLFVNTIGFQPLQLKTSGLSSFTDLSLKEL